MKKKSLYPVFYEPLTVRFNSISDIDVWIRDPIKYEDLNKKSFTRIMVLVLVFSSFQIYPCFVILDELTKEAWFGICHL